MCHFYICLDFHSGCGAKNSLKTWVDYLFPLDGPLESRQTLADDKRITKAMRANDHEDVILEEDDRDYERGDIFLSFHCLAKILTSRKALLVGFLSAWLKRCVIPARPHDSMTLLVIFSAVQLVYG